MTSSDEQWIDAADAVKFTVLRCGQALHKQILERARDRIIQTRAKHYVVTGPNRRAPLRTHAPQIDNYYRLPPEFFWAGSGQALEVDWTTGDFSTWIDSTWHCRAYGVQFLEAEIRAMCPPARPESDSAGHSVPPRKHTVRETEQWMRTVPTINADDAFNFYKAHPGYNGMKQAEFRGLWQKIKGTTRGAQKRTKS